MWKRSSNNVLVSLLGHSFPDPRPPQPSPPDDHVAVRQAPGCAPARRYEVPGDKHSVAVFREHLTERFAISKPGDSLQLSIDGYALLPEAALTILRDGDLVSVAVTAPALPAAAKGRRKRALPDADPEQPVNKRRTAAKAANLALEAPPLPAAAAPSAQDPLEKASSSSEASSSADGGCGVVAPECSSVGVDSVQAAR